MQPLFQTQVSYFIVLRPSGTRRDRPLTDSSLLRFTSAFQRHFMCKIGQIMLGACSTGVNVNCRTSASVKIFSPVDCPFRCDLTVGCANLHAQALMSIRASGL